MFLKKTLQLAAIVAFMAVCCMSCVTAGSVVGYDQYGNPVVAVPVYVPSPVPVYVPAPYYAPVYVGPYYGRGHYGGHHRRDGRH